MKKLVAFALILTLGLFTAVGCSKPAEKAKKEPPKTEVGKDTVAKPAPDATRPATDDKAK